MNDKMIYDIIRNNGLTEKGTFNAGLFQPIRNKSGKVFVKYNGQMVETTKLEDQFPFLKNETGLPEDSWKMIADKINGYVKPRTSAYADLINKGLVTNVNDVGVMVYSQPKHSALGEAERNMTGRADKVNDEFKFGVDKTPLPVTFKDVSTGWRVIAAMKRGGFDFIASGTQSATESVLQKLEKSIFSEEFEFDGITSHSYTTSNNIQTGNLDYDWSAAATTAAQIWADILKIEASVKSNLVNYEAGKGIGYLPIGWKRHWNDVFTNGDSRQTLGEKIKTLDWIEDFKEQSYQVAKKVTIAFMQSMYVSMVRGAGLQAIKYPSPDGLESYIKIMAIESPIICSDYNGKKGVFTFTKA